jgi:hypothetical protein
MLHLFEEWRLFHHLSFIVAKEDRYVAFVVDLPFGLRERVVSTFFCGWAMIGWKFEVFNQIIDQNPYGRYNSPLGGEYEMDGDFLGVLVGQDPDKALHPHLIFNHVSRQQGDPQAGCGDLEQ